MLCPKCGKNVSASADSCGYCGYIINKKSDSGTGAANYRENIKKLFSSVNAYISATALSLSVLFSIISILAAESNGAQILEFLGFDAILKPVAEVIGEANIFVYLVLTVPAALFCIGLWSAAVNFESKNAKPLLFIKISTVIRLVLYTALFAIIFLLLANSVAGTAKYAEKYVTAALAMLALCALAAAVVCIIYFRHILKAVEAIEYSASAGKPVKLRIKLIFSLNCIIAVFQILLCLDCGKFKMISNALSAVFLVSVSVLLSKAGAVLAPHIRKPEPKSTPVEKPSGPAKMSVKRERTARPYIPKETEQMSFAIPGKNKKYCVKCGEMIAEDATTCPFCHANQDPVSQQHFKI